MRAGTWLKPAMFLAALAGCRVEIPLDPESKQSAVLKTGITLKFREAGAPTGETVLMLHGITDTSRSFLPAMRHLAELRPDLHLIALDLRGHGDSAMPAAEGCRSSPENCFGVDDFAADVIAFMDSRGIQQAYLVGHSLGSAVAQEVALTSPGRVKRVVLIATVARFSGTFAVADFLLGSLIEGPWKQAAERQGRKWPDDVYDLMPRDLDPAADAWLRAYWVDNPVADPALLADIAPETQSIRLGTWIGAARGLNVYDNTERLKDLSVPALVLWPSQDALFRDVPEQAELKAVLKDAADRCRTTYHYKVYGRQPLPASGMQEGDVGHNLQWDAPEAVARDLASYLKEGGEPARELTYASPGDPRRIESIPSRDLFLIGRGERCPS
ncbi:MAG: alpha/beta fold hydrolase [Candidatus Polarisedimenticolia bacterium]